MTRTSCVMPNSAQASAAAFIVGQSVSLPIKIPTKGLEDEFLFMRTHLPQVSATFNLQPAGRESGFQLCLQIVVEQKSECRRVPPLRGYLRWHFGVPVCMGWFMFYGQTN